MIFIKLNSVALSLPFCDSLILPFMIQLRCQMKIVIRPFLGTVMLTKLKLDIHVNNVWMHFVYCNQFAGAYLSLYSFIFLSLQFKHLTFSSHFLRSNEAYKTETVYIHEQWVDISHIHESGCCCCCCLFAPLFVFHVFFLSSSLSLNIFVTLFSGTVRCAKMKRGTLVDNGWIYCVYRNKIVSMSVSLYFVIFLLSNFQTLKYFVHFSQGIQSRNLLQT